MNWQNVRVILTGGSSGIGACLLKLLKEKKANVVFGGHIEFEVKQQSELTGYKGIVADLSKEEELVCFFETAINHLGGVDVLINNAGFVIAESFEDLSRAHFEYMFAINTIAPARLSQLVLPFFRKNKQGDILNIGATGAYYAFEKGAAYSASKSALQIVSQNLCLEYRKENIRVFHIDPSWCTDTNNNNYGTPIPQDAERLNPSDITESIIHVLEMNRRAFVPQMKIFGTKL